MVLQQLKKILAQKNEMKFQTSEGELLDLKKDMEIEKGKIVMIDAKDNLYNYLFGKKRINENDVKELVETFEKVKQFINDNSSYPMKKKLKEVLK